MDHLRTQCFDDVPYFSFSGFSGLVKVVDIYDGDTCTIIFSFGDKLCKYRCRLVGIDCCELRPSRDMPDRDEHISGALAARNRLASLVLGSETVASSRNELRQQLSESTRLNYCQVGDYDKYGRLLIELWPGEESDGANINKILVCEGLAKQMEC